MMSHEITAVTHLLKNGNISDYSYKCDMEGINSSISIDYIRRLQAGYRFKYHITIRNHNLIEPILKVPYIFSYYTDLENSYKTYDLHSSTKVIYSNSGIKPEPDSKQLTGPGNSNYNPQFSTDGNRIYFQSNNYTEKSIIFRTIINGEGIENIKIFDNSLEITSYFNIIDNNHLAYALWSPKKFSRIGILDLTNMNCNEYEVKGYLWGSLPVRIPNTNKFLNLSDPNSSVDFRTKLLTADIQTQKVDTLIKNLSGWIYNYSTNPVNKNLYMVVSSSKTNDVVEYNFETKETSVFMSEENMGSILS